MFSLSLSLSWQFSACVVLSFPSQLKFVVCIGRLILSEPSTPALPLSSKSTSITHSFHFPRVYSAIPLPHTLSKLISFTLFFLLPLFLLLLFLLLLLLLLLFLFSFATWAHFFCLDIYRFFFCSSNAPLFPFLFLSECVSAGDRGGGARQRFRLFLPVYCSFSAKGGQKSNSETWRSLVITTAEPSSVPWETGRGTQTRDKKSVRSCVKAKWSDAF